MNRAFTRARGLRVALGAALLFSTLSSRRAAASATFPGTIQAQLGLTSPPGCTLCHRSDLGGAGTVISPFGRTMVNHFGLTGSNIDALKGALAGSDAEHLDSDGDGAPDIEELRAGSDPNVGLSGEPAPLGVPLPETGCNFTLGPPQDLLPALACALAGLVFMHRRSQGRSGRRREET